MQEHEEIELIEEQEQRLTDSSRDPETARLYKITLDEQGQSPSERLPLRAGRSLEVLPTTKPQRSYFKKLQLQVDEQIGESHSSSDTILEKQDTTKNATGALFANQTPSEQGLMQEIQFENSSKNSEQIAPISFKKTDQQVNIIDKLLSERDS